MLSSLSRNIYSKIKSALFVPGSQEKMLQKSLDLDPHIIVPDLEDSVPLAKKHEARILVKSHIMKRSSLNSQAFVFPRINPITSDLSIADIEELITYETIGSIHGLVVPKVETFDEYNAIHQKLTELETKLKVTNKILLKLIIFIESPLGLLNLKDILSADRKQSSRIIATAFGVEDFCESFQIPRSQNLKEIEVARSLFALNSAAFGVLALDTPFVEFKNEKGLIEEIKYIRSLGFKGKFAIHPSQIAAINKYFSSGEKEIEEAKKIVEAFEKALKEGKAAIEVDDNMVDIPVYKRALNILERNKS